MNEEFVMNMPLDQLRMLVENKDVWAESTQKQTKTYDVFAQNDKPYKNDKINDTDVVDLRNYEHIYTQQALVLKVYQELKKSCHDLFEVNVTLMNFSLGIEPINEFGKILTPFSPEHKRKVLKEMHRKIKHMNEMRYPNDWTLVLNQVDTPQ